MKQKHSALLGLSLFALTLVPSFSASAQILLTINDSDPNAVTITATGNPSLINVSDLDEHTAGIDLLSFLTTDDSFFGAYSPTGTLTPNGSTVAYNILSADNYSGSYIDVNLGSYFASAPQDFSTAAPAFTGMITLDLSSFASELPADGASGGILDGASFNNNNDIIGSWKVENITATPEPGMTSLLALGLVAGGFLAYHRRAQIAA